jgi:large subunit ribosomal protein L24
MSTKVHRNDIVEVITGSDRGKKGRVLRVDSEKGRVLVEHVRMIKKAVKPNPQRNIAGGIAEQEAFIHISNVMVVDGGEKTRIGYKIEGKSKIRIGRKTGAEIQTKAGKK